MSELSPAAQTVLDAYYCEKPLVGSKRVAAALRAAADQVVPASPDMISSLMMVRYRLLAIADELET
jgi:hypothetical protein